MNANKITVVLSVVLVIPFVGVAPAWAGVPEGLSVKAGVLDLVKTSVAPGSPDYLLRPDVVKLNGSRRLRDDGWVERSGGLVFIMR